MACKMRRAQVGRGAFPPSARLDVMSMATRKPARYHCSATRWSLDALVATVVVARALRQRRHAQVVPAASWPRRLRLPGLPVPTAALARAK